MRANVKVLREKVNELSIQNEQNLKEKLQTVFLYFYLIF